MARVLSAKGARGESRTQELVAPAKANGPSPADFSPGDALAVNGIETLVEKLILEKVYLEEEVRTEQNFDEIVGQSTALRRVLKEVETVAPTTSTVMIYGETGTGKELIARTLHDLSTCRQRTFVKLNCAAIPSGLLESELFGHEKGAFTGALMPKVGRFEVAHQGTLFLDEVGDLPLILQAKLLRVLQKQEFERLGSTRTLKVTVRVVAASNRDLAPLVAEGAFRCDLYHRLNVFPVVLPPLRKRREDIPHLVRYFTHKFARRMGRRIEAIPDAAMNALVEYPWPGNVRELENVIERAVILSPKTVLRLDPTQLWMEADKKKERATLAETERAHILAALRASNWVVDGPNGAAVRLAMKRTTLQSKMKKLGVRRPKGTWADTITPLDPASAATGVRVQSNRPLVIDGPFAETREQIGG
jgi:formate hydrogenlyase transcriptional activator